MRYLIAASLINIVLDLILVGWLRMGVAAAAFATIASPDGQRRSGIYKLTALPKRRGPCIGAR